MIFDHSHLLFLSVFLFGYFIGSIPFGLLLSKLFGLGDIRKIGSGNIGATNVLRTGNKKIALLTLMLDGTKGALAIYVISITPSFVEFNLTNNNNLFQSLVAVSAVIGHCFPIWLNLKGGKGVATFVGILISINIYYAVVFGIVWILTFFISKYSSLSSLFASISIPIYLLVVDQGNIVFFIIMFVLIFYTHRENIKRLINKEETKSKIY